MDDLQASQVVKEEDLQSEESLDEYDSDYALNKINRMEGQITTSIQLNLEEKIGVQD